MKGTLYSNGKYEGAFYGALQDPRSLGDGVRARRCTAAGLSWSEQLLPSFELAPTFWWQVVQNAILSQGRRFASRQTGNQPCVFLPKRTALDLLAARPPLSAAAGVLQTLYQQPSSNLWARGQLVMQAVASWEQRYDCCELCDASGTGAATCADSIHASRDPSVMGSLHSSFISSYELQPSPTDLPVFPLCTTASAAPCSTAPRGFEPLLPGRLLLKWVVVYVRGSFP